MPTVLIELQWRIYLKAIPAAVALWIIAFTPLFAAERQPNLQDWLADLRREALASGISPATLNGALGGFVPIQKVIELDRNQPEFTWPLEEYLGRLVTEARVVKGRERLAEHQMLLAAISKRYGVQPQFIIALWGIETDYGRLTGSFPVIGATATLAYDGRRSVFFRRELLHALRILEQGHISADQMLGSWAGAMGQFHFMPSSFQRFAVDHEGDGRIDIWKSLGDSFASAANYLSKFGWKRDQNWGQEVGLPTGFNTTLIGLETRKALSEWVNLGVRHASSRDLSEKPSVRASLLEPDGEKGRTFLVYDNYRVILDWNRSHLFAIAVGILADRIVGHPME